MRKITVLTPFYNSESFMEIPYQAMLAQTYPNWEWVCVDDNSNEGTLKKLNEWAASDSRIKVVHREVNGGNAARANNTGLPLCSGAYIQLLGHDDELSPETLEEINQRIDETGAQIVIPDAEVVHTLCGGGQNSRLVGIYDENENKKSDDEKRARILTGKEACMYSIGWLIHGWACYSKSLLEQCGGFDEEGMNGDEYSVRVFMLHADKVAFSRGTYRYLRRPTSISNKLSVRFFDTFVTTRKLEKLIRDNGFGKEVKGRQDEHLFYTYQLDYKAWKFHAEGLSVEERKKVDKIMKSAWQLLRENYSKRIIYRWRFKMFKATLYWRLWRIFGKKLKREGIIS